MIGAGAAGLVRAYIAAALKAIVILVEVHKMGSDCLNYGCVSSEALIKLVRVAHQSKHGTHYGSEDSTPQFSFKKVIERVQRVVQRVQPHCSVERNTKFGVEVLQDQSILEPS